MGLVHFPIELNSMAVGAFRASCAVMVRITNISYQNSSFAHRFPDHDDSQLDVCFEFDRLKENDPNTAILAEKQAKTKHKAVSMQELRQHMLVVRPMNYWPRPPQVVQVRRHANDTEVPRFQVDWDKEEAQCDWRGLFTALYSEDKLATTLTRRMVRLLHCLRVKLTSP